ncbi:MAG: hypothetical protein CMG32_02680 [Candidatus Marinimicrobia bacterium]|jgi:TolB-like protein|nr:hypothetical protein [Candidatus Neomarinimicrobiota bacterium]|tara:strand:+ start:527 stop:2509 length:1983 start_codon:yes stop_codon:yes gene_type:complete
MSFLEELKQRKVFRTATAYAVVAFVIMQIVEIVFPMFDIPEWAGRMIIILLFIGFPVIIVFSWVFDVTEKGLVRSQPMDTSDTRSTLAKKRTWFAAGGIILGVLLGYFVASSLGKNNPVENNRSIAVLPFDNMSDSKDDEYFSDGITEDIITYLSKIEGLKVISRTSIMQYKDSKMNIKDIAKELGVSNILEGSVRRAGERVRITGQLINALTDEHLWADSYDRDLKDIFSVQTDVAKNIANALKSELSESDKKHLSNMLTDNSLAYDYYLRSKNAPPNKEGLYLIVDLLNKAIELDPNFVVAYADLSKTEGWIYFSGIEKTFAMLARSKAAADKALELDPESAEAHVALGLYFYRGYLDYDRAMYEFEIANKLDPNGEIALSVMAWVVRRQGNFKKSAEYVERAVESDPRNATMMGQLFPTYLILGDIEKANEWMDKALDIQPENVTNRSYKDWQYLVLYGDIVKTRQKIKRTQEIVGDDKFNWKLALIDILDSNYNDALKILNGIPEDQSEDQHEIHLKSFYHGWIYDLQGLTERSTAKFEEARNHLLDKIGEHPEDPRYRSLLGKTYAHLGDMEKAIKMGNSAKSLWPLSKDALGSIWYIRHMADIYAILGEKEMALNELNQLTTIPVFPRKGIYKVNPIWSDYLDDPRFQKILENI